jgi:molybdopterin/thiamine biosynthesis adenylyltransferase
LFFHASHSNPNRQVVFRTADFNLHKAVRAAAQFEVRNPDVQATVFMERANRENLFALIAAHNFTLECSDNVEAKLLFHDRNVEMNKPFSYCGVIGTTGSVVWERVLDLV